MTVIEAEKINEWIREPQSQENAIIVITRVKGEIDVRTKMKGEADRWIESGKKPKSEIELPTTADDQEITNDLPF